MGDIGAGNLECDGSRGVPSVSIFEVTLFGYAGLDFYNVNIVDGYNLQMRMLLAANGTGYCSAVDCSPDLMIYNCPPALYVAQHERDNSPVVACKSACAAFGSLEYCCIGFYASSETCTSAIDYSRLFKDHCHTAYSYVAYNDANSTFTCTNPTILCNFCAWKHHFSSSLLGN
ncbi:hypothetical protein L7F22_057510 [Adiantum nelumboides]|nr:hypothetical protein [Adiantum nelumboides]